MRPTLKPGEKIRRFLEGEVLYATDSFAMIKWADGATWAIDTRREGRGWERISPTSVAKDSTGG